VGTVNWREYRWSVQRYIDRAGKVVEKSIQVLTDCRGSRTEFLATFKRKLLAWLEHRQHLQWDRMWQNNNVSVDDGEHSLRVANMAPGDVHVRIDFIKNAELHSPNQAQREYFIHQYLSLLCAVVQYKTVDKHQREELHSRTIMFCSNDKKHDGVFTADCLEHLATKVSFVKRLFPSRIVSSRSFLSSLACTLGLVGRF
jgi:hypothetical protein